MASPGARPDRKPRFPRPGTKAAPDPPAPVAEEIEASDIPELKADEIARLAYSYWEARGCEGGSAEEDWLRAEQELRARKSKSR